MEKKTPPSNRSVFLSYSASGDEGSFVHNVVEQLYQDLTAHGHRVWDYERHSVGANHFREAYKRNIQESDFFVVFCNASARSSEFIEEEIRTAINSAKKIIPVQLDQKPPHPLLDPLELAAIPYYDRHRRNRVYLLHQVLKAMGDSVRIAPGDKFVALGQYWKVYQCDLQLYPICNPDCIQLLGSQSHRMDIQTETDFTYGSVQLEAQSNWHTESSVGFEKWYGRDRYSIALQGDGNVWGRWRGRVWSKNENFPVSDWRRIQREPLVLRIDWRETETTVSVNGMELCRTKTQIHRPLKLRLNADFDDYLLARDVHWPGEDEGR